MRRANRLKSFPESRPFPDFFISTLLRVSTGFLLPIFLRASVGSFILRCFISLRAFFVQSRAEHFWNGFSPIHVGKILVRALEGRLGVYWEMLRIYRTRFRWRWWNRVWKWKKKRSCGVEWKSESVRNISGTIFNILSFLFALTLAVELLSRGKKIRIDSLMYLSRERNISRSILRKRRVLLKIVFSRSTI